MSTTSTPPTPKPSETDLITELFKDKLKSWFLTTYILSFLFWNKWDILKLIFGNKKFDEKVVLIEKSWNFLSFSSVMNYLIPLCFVILLMMFIPRIDRLIKIHKERIKSEESEKLAEILEHKYLSKKDSFALINKYDELYEKYLNTDKINRERIERFQAEELKNKDIISRYEKNMSEATIKVENLADQLEKAEKNETLNDLNVQELNSQVAKLRPMVEELRTKNKHLEEVSGHAIKEKKEMTAFFESRIEKLNTLFKNVNERQSKSDSQFGGIPQISEKQIKEAQIAQEEFNRILKFNPNFVKDAEETAKRLNQ